MLNIEKCTLFGSFFLQYVHLFMYFLVPSMCESLFAILNCLISLSGLISCHRNASEIKGKRRRIHLLLVKFSSSMGRRSGTGIISVKLISHKDLHLMKMDTAIAVLPNICKSTDHYFTKVRAECFKLFFIYSVCRI